MASPTHIIQRSVGLGGANQPADVRIVQKLINAVPAAKGGPSPALAVDGLCGPFTCAAISRFQAKNIGSADGRIDPGQRTQQVLLALLDALGLLAALLSGAAGPISQPSPPAAGSRSPIRQRFMDICRQILPPHGALTVGAKSGPKGTGCGEFPGRVFARVPVIPPGQPGAFKVRLGAQNCFLTTPMTAWEQFAKAVDQQYAARTWVTFGGNRPRPGDIYILSQYENTAMFQHVGVIVSADGNEWMTADGGQGNGWQSGFVKRQFQADGRIDGEFGSKARLRGWVDLDALFAVAVSAFPANLLMAA
jgi:peptidoglycan hydrolase-like protein with peptidoglycan-binding domain